MAVSTTAALIGMGAAKLVGGAIGAKKGSSAAKKAANIQTASANRAIDMQRQIWGQQQQNISPYMQAGGNAMGLLGSLMMPPGQPGAYRPGQPPTMPPMGMGPGGPGPGGLMPPGGPGMGGPMPNIETPQNYGPGARPPAQNGLLGQMMRQPPSW